MLRLDSTRWGLGLDIDAILKGLGCPWSSQHVSYLGGQGGTGLTEISNLLSGLCQLRLSFLCTTPDQQRAKKHAIRNVTARQKSTTGVSVRKCDGIGACTSRPEIFVY